MFQNFTSMAPHINQPVAQLGSQSSFQPIRRDSNVQGFTPVVKNIAQNSGVVARDFTIQNASECQPTIKCRKTSTIASELLSGLF